MIIYSKSFWLATKALANPPSSLGIVIRTSPTTISPLLELTSVSKNKNSRVLSVNYRFGILLDRNDLEPSPVPTIEVHQSFMQALRLSWSFLIWMTLSPLRKSRITGWHKPRITLATKPSFLSSATNVIWSMLFWMGASNNFQGKQESRTTMYQPKQAKT